MTTYNDEMMRVFLNYYSFDNNGTKTISIRRTETCACEYAVLGNGEIILMGMTRAEMEQAARLCIEMGITINPVIKH